VPFKLKAFRIKAHDRVTPEHLNVAPQLLGMPLAAPGVRLLAIAVDVLVVVLLSNFGNLWLFAGLALPIALAQHLRRGGSASARQRGFVRAAAAGLIAVGLQQAWVAPAQHRPGLHLSQGAADTDAADLAEAVGAIASAPGMSAEQRAAARIAVLEAALAQARQPKPFHLREQLALWADEVGIGLGWAIAYFSLLPAWWNGQTVGKKLFGLRVVELTGKPLTVMRAFKRYGGYAAGMATGFFGFLQIFWDGNRQAIQDKTAHTVVIDLRRASREGPAAGEPDRTLPVP
jgi:uncharacterized RDD family membrane protein YckC